MDDGDASSSSCLELAHAEGYGSIESLAWCPDHECAEVARPTRDLVVIADHGNGAITRRTDHSFGKSSGQLGSCFCTQGSGESHFGLSEGLDGHQGDMAPVKSLLASADVDGLAHLPKCMTATTGTDLRTGLSLTVCGSKLQIRLQPGPARSKLLVQARRRYRRSSLRRDRGRG